MALLAIKTSPFPNLFSITYNSATRGKLQMKDSVAGTFLTNNAYIFKLAYSITISNTVFLLHSGVQ